MGIDFGAAYVRAGYMRAPDEVIVPHNREGTTATPAVVGFEEMEGGGASVFVGELAELMAQAEPESCCKSVLWKLGVDTVAMVLQGKEYSPEQIAALILKKVARDAEEALKIEVGEIVSTYPAALDSE